MTKVLGISNFEIIEGYNVQAKLSIKTCLGHKQIKNISFQCQRFVIGIDSRIFDVFMNAIRGNAHLDVINQLLCSHQQVAGGFGNVRNQLTECSCLPLDRKTNPNIRLNYENKVITTILSHLNVKNQTPFSLKLAIFCSGGLLGEEILLFRLIDQLVKNNLNGTIDLFLIDPCYKDAIDHAHHDGTLVHAVGRAKYMEQFIIDLCHCLPPLITVNGTFFSSSESYTQQALKNSNFKHDLLIGADIEDATIHMDQMNKQAGLYRSVKPISLIKTNNNESYLYSLDAEGNLQSCYQSIDGGIISACEQEQIEPFVSDSNSSSSSSDSFSSDQDDSLVVDGIALLLLTMSVASFVFSHLLKHPKRH